MIPGISAGHVVKFCLLPKFCGMASANERAASPDMNILGPWKMSLIFCGNEKSTRPSKSVPSKKV